MPKDYQISQFDEPLNVEGWLELPDGTRIGIERAHLEEDTGKSSHQGGDGRIHGAESSLVDYNRAGVPLIEIVGEPDLRSADDARAYVSELRAILVAIGASDGKMEEGSMRVDANVSVRPARHRRARAALRDQERELAAVAGAGHRVRGPSSGRRPRCRRASAPGDPPLGRGGRTHPRRPLEGGRRGLPLLPRARPRGHRPVARVDRRDRGRPAGAAGRATGPAGRRRRACLRPMWPSTSTAASTTWRWGPSRRAPTRGGC